MEEEYYEITSQIDAREILRYLNSLGIRNISGEILKYFITDLKKLIKYDLAQKYKKYEQDLETPGPERLHSASTFCSRLRSKSNTGPVPKCSKECRSGRRPFIVRPVHSAPVLGQRTANIEEQQKKPPRRACSCVREEKKPEKVPKESKEVFSNANLIKVPKQPVRKKCDPVSLYHYYTSLWDKYKSNLPGQNDWADLRWSIRQKMAGSTVSTARKVSEQKLRSSGERKL